MLLNASQYLEISYWFSQLDGFLTEYLPSFWVLLIEFVLISVALLTLYAVLALF